MWNITKNLQTLGEHSKLYCVWIRENESAHAPLVCIWIDPQMTAFESGSARELRGVASELTVVRDEDEPGGSSVCVSGVFDARVLAGTAGY